MSLFGTMRTGVSGMTAQSNALSTIADNISNSGTTGYKRATAEFSSMVNAGDQTNISLGGVTSYTSGGVATDVRYSIADQGVIEGTSTTTDLAINGNGFFVVNNSDGAPYLTRAGSFVPDSSGNLVNAAGFYLMGYDLNGNASTGVANGLAGLERVNINQEALTANASTDGTLSVNLPAGATAVPAANLPSTNAPGATFTEKTSLVTYDNLGNAVTLDVYMSKTGPNAWEVAVYNQADAATGGGFPYAAGPLATQNLTFDGTTGDIAAATPNTVSVPIPNGQTFTLDMSNTTQLGASFATITATANGNAPSALDHIEIGNDGTLYSVYQDGARVASYKIPLANVPSTDNLTPQSGNVFSPSIGSGDIVVGSAGLGGLGAIDSSSLEQSTVDLATELTAMIEAQRAFTANSKVFQAGADLMQTVVNLQTQ